MNEVAQKRSWAVLALFAVMAAGCGGTTAKPDGGKADSGTNDGSCVESEDCPDPSLFFCLNFKCEPSCHNKSDCTVATRGAQFQIGYCDTGIGCQCDEGRCVGTLCSADSDCGGQVCRNGQCVAAPAASTVASCQITPDVVVMKAGGKTAFHVSAWDSAKAPVIIKDGATWSAVGSILTLSSAATGNDADFTAANATTGADAVESLQAAFGTVTCKAKVVVVPSAVTAGKLNVIVVDELSGRPIKDAKVVVSGLDGAAITQGANAYATTDARGFVELSVATSAPASVTAFHSDYSYLTVANYSTAGSNFLALALRRNQVDNYGGYRGTFKNVPQNSNVHAALAGMSLAGSITDLSISQLLGPSVPKDITIGSSINQKNVPIPAGVYLSFAENMIKTDIAGQGLAGTCVDASGNPDEAKIAAGTCGTRTAWALAGDVPIATVADLATSVTTGGTANIDVTQVLGRITPLFKGFNSTIVRDVQFDLKPTPRAAGQWNFSDTSFFTKADHDFQQVPLAFPFAVKLGELPKFKGTYADGALVLGGANVQGRGVVPLGLGVGVNTSPATDGLIDKPVDLKAAGLIPMRMAPTHHGLEGADYGLLVAAVSAKALTDASAGLAMSALYARVSGNKLAFDPKGDAPVDLSGQAFPAFLEGAKYNFTDTDQPALAKRTFKLPGAAPANVTVARVSFTDGMDRHWDVVADASALSAGFTLPKPPGALADRTFSDSLSTGQRSTMLVQGFRLNSAPSASGTALTFNNLVEFNDTNLDNLTRFLTAFSVVDYSRPSVAITDPKAGTASIAKGYKVVVAAKNFKIGAGAGSDGVVRLSLTSGGAAIAGCDAMKLDTETVAGNGTLEKVLPTACAGTNVKMMVELMDPTGATPIAPFVNSSITLNIQ